MVGVGFILAGQEDKVHVLESSKIGESLLNCRPKTNVRLGESGARHNKHQRFIRRKTKALAIRVATAGIAEARPDRNARHLDGALGDLSRT